ncbi:hypothetical protein LTS10_001385 [Elasticomyces elasticus]|nr:hypothetical protein LTS10_001385 [Elasticomyces elasticus]
MSSLLALLSQQGTSLQTRKGLILLGLQNDFLLPEGKLPVSTDSGFLDRVKQLVPSFREFGTVIWVRSEFEANRDPRLSSETGDTVIAGTHTPSDDGRSIKEGSKRSAGNQVNAPMKRMKATEAQDDPELFLSRTSTREPCCIRGSGGEKHPPDVAALIDKVKDMQVVKTHYSAFGSTTLLTALRSKLITELFVCGCNTNLSVFATAMDAARHGIKITLVEDCLGFRKKERHDEAIRQLVEIMDASVMTSERAIDVLKHPSLYEEEEDEEEDEDEDEDEHEESEEEYGAVQTLAQLRVSQKSQKPTSGDYSSTLDMSAALAADSDEDDEEEMVLPNVRSSRVPSDRLALRYTSTRAHRPPIAVDTKQPPEYAQSANSYSTDSCNLRANDLVAEPQSMGTVDANCLQSKIELARDCSGMSQDCGEASIDFSDVGEVKPNLPSPLGELVQGSNDSPFEHKEASSNPNVTEAVQETVVTNSSPNAQAVTNTKQSLTPAPSTDEAKMSSHGTPLFGEDKAAESAGSRILYDLLPIELADTVFAQLNSEIEWQRMHHQTGEVPRLVCCEGSIAGDGSMPLYRHPSDETLPLRPWSPTVEIIRQAAEAAVGHPLNHVLIQLYRGGTDFISEHSDKTLDIANGSSIVNVSFGAQRTMRLRTKRGAAAASTATSDKVSPPLSRTTYRVPMPHNSMLIMSLRTNAQYLHGINADKRPAEEFTEAEKAYGGHRISLTFRHIATFLEGGGERIWGQGATSKTRAEAGLVVNDNAAECERLVRAFGAENAASSIDWTGVYGNGSDVLHLRHVRAEKESPASSNVDQA